MKQLFRHSLLWGILIPVILIGIASTVILSSLLTRPLIASLKEKVDITIQHAANMALSTCEERFSDLLDLRMADNPEMNAASKKESIEEIKRISTIFPNIKVIILDEAGEMLAASFELPEGPLIERDVHLQGKRVNDGIFSSSLWGRPVIARSLYFPFWRWQIITFISEEDYLAPIHMAKRIVSVGTFGTLLIVVFTVLFVFLWKVNRPLKAIIRATDDVRKGTFATMQVKGKDEIARVAVAFNEMVGSLASDKKQLDTIMGDLRESEEQYRILTENSLAVIAMLQNGRFLYSNTMMNKILGYAPMEILNYQIYDLCSSTDSVDMRRRLEALESGELEIDHFEKAFTTSDGKEVWLEILATPISYQGKQAVLIHAIDISSKKQGQAEREELQKKLTRIEKMEAVGTLAGGVAHDLNNILSGIVGYPELLLLDMPEEAPLYKPLTTIQKSGMKAAAIVQDMLTLTRRGVVVTEIVNLNDIINEYLQSPEFDKLTSYHPQTRVMINLTPDLMNIDGSPVHLAKTIMNLMTNAMEAMPDGGEIYIETGNRYVDTPIGSYDTVVEGEYVTFSITDKGTGISSNDIEKIFEPFYTKKVMGRSGTGLGMSVVWGTVKDHHGYIEASSSEGVGTTFILYFPVTRRSGGRKDDSFDLASTIDPGKTILVVDDVEEQRIIATSILERLQFKVTAVASGEAAIDYLKTNSVDLILLDMIMEPGIDGLDTYREILKMHPQQKAIIASGYSETSRIREAQQLGADTYVKKPYVLQTIATAIKNALSKE